MNRHALPRACILAVLGSAAAVACGADSGDAEASLPGDHVAGLRIDTVPLLAREHAPVPPLEDHPADTLALARAYGDADAFGTVNAIHAAGRFLVVVDRYEAPPIVLVDMVNGEVVHRVGGRGEGPEEFRSPQALVEGPTPGEVGVFDFQNRRLTHLEIDPGGPSLRIVGDTPFRVAESILEVHPWGSGFAAPGLFVGYSVAFLGDAGEFERRFHMDPPVGWDELPSYTGLRLVNRAYMARHPSRPVLVLVYQFGNRFDFFLDPLGPDGGYFSVPGPRPTRPAFELRDGRFHWLDENEMAYSAVDATERFVYALFCGCAMKDDDGGRTRLHVFSWDGHFIAELAFDRPVRKLRVARDDSRVWADFEDPWPLIGEWRLPEWLVGRDGEGAERG